MAFRKYRGCLGDDAFQDVRHLALAEDLILNGLDEIESHVLNNHRFHTHTRVKPSSHRAISHPHRSCDNMSFRQSFSRFRKKAKDKASNIGNRIKQRACVSSEGLDHSTLSLQSEPAIVVEGGLGRGTGLSEGSGGLQPGDYLSVSQSMAELEREPGGSYDHTAQQERGQKGLHPDAYKRTGRGTSQERGDLGGERIGHVDPPPQLGPDTGSTWTTPFQSPSLMDDPGNPAVPGPVRIGAATSKNESDWTHTTSSAAKLLLHTVERASNAFPPLKSVVAGLCAILDNCEVRSTFVHLIHAYVSRSKQWSTNRR